MSKYPNGDVPAYVVYQLAGFLLMTQTTGRTAQHAGASTIRKLRNKAPLSSSYELNDLFAMMYAGRARSYSYEVASNRLDAAKNHVKKRAIYAKLRIRRTKTIRRLITYLLIFEHQRASVLRRIDRA